MNQLSKPQDPDFSDETLDAAFAEIDDLQSDQPEFDVPEVETIELMDYFISPDRFSTGFNWRSVALTIQKWMDDSDNHRVLLLTGEDPQDPDPEVLVLSYGKIDLWIFQGKELGSSVRFRPQNSSEPLRGSKQTGGQSGAFLPGQLLF